MFFYCNGCFSVTVYHVVNKKKNIDFLFWVFFIHSISCCDGVVQITLISVFVIPMCLSVIFPMQNCHCSCLFHRFFFFFFFLFSSSSSSSYFTLFSFLFFYFFLLLLFFLFFFVSSFRLPFSFKLSYSYSFLFSVLFLFFFFRSLHHLSMAS